MKHDPIGISLVEIFSKLKKKTNSLVFIAVTKRGVTVSCEQTPPLPPFDRMGVALEGISRSWMRRLARRASHSSRLSPFCWATPPALGGLRGSGQVRMGVGGRVG